MNREIFNLSYRGRCAFPFFTNSSISKTRGGITADQPTDDIMMADLHTPLRSLQRSGRLIGRTVLPRCSVGLRKSIAYSAPAVESDRIVDESSRVLSQRVGVDDRTEKL